jgi:uncharacterized protein (TIGR02647 family)
MTVSPALLDEIAILNQFNLDSMQAGIKIHSHSASPALVEAAGRLYAKGLVTLPDGGYLTGLGLDAARHAQSLLMILKG